MSKNHKKESELTNIQEQITWQNSRSHCLFEGKVVHERFEPKHHKLSYSMAQVWVDLDEISTLDQHSHWWSIEKFNAVSFYRKDYLPGDDNLKKAVIDKIHAETGHTFEGKIFLLTNLRYWGYCYNPCLLYTSPSPRDRG